MEDGDTEKYHASSLIQDFVSSSTKMGCIRCISSQVYNKFVYRGAKCYNFRIIMENKDYN